MKRIGIFPFAVFIIWTFSNKYVYSQKVDTSAFQKYLEMSIDELLNINIITASKYEQKIRETPASLYVFTRSDIEENGYQYLSDLLRYIPNMEIHWSGGPQYIAETELRGMSEFILLLDGIPINPASSVAPHLGYVYPLNNVKKVEIMMGPSSALYGADASAGIINIITFEPDEKISTGKVEVFGGNHENYGSQILLQQTFKKVYTQLSLSFFNINDKDKSWWKYLNDAYSGYPDSSSNHYETNYANPLQSITSSGKVKLGNTTVGFNFWTRDVDGGLRLDPVQYNANKHTKTSGHEYLLYIQNKDTLNNNLSLHSQLSYHYYQVRYNFYYTKINLDDPKYYRESADRIHWLEELDYSVADNTRLLIGLEARSIISVPKTYNAITDSTGKEIGFGEPISNNEALTCYQIRSAGMFLQLENYFFSNRLKTNIGIRSDYYSTFGWSTNPRASVYFKMADPLSIRLMYGMAFYTPPPDKMYRTTYVPGLRYQTSNENLQPRTNNNFEIAIDYKPFSRLSIGGRAFINDVRDEFVFVNTVETYVAGTDTVDIYQYQNVGLARYKGAEVSFHSILPYNVKFRSNISFLNGFRQKDINSDKEDLNLNSEFIIAWNLNRIFYKKFMINLQGLHLINRFAKEGNLLYPDGKMSDIFLLNLNLRVNNIWNGLGGNLKIVNLLDKKWGDIPGTSESASPEFPQERRRIMLGINWSF